MPPLSLRRIEDGDLELLFAWAHIPYIWEHMTTSRKKEDLRWEQHLSWWNRPDRNNGRWDWMIVYGKRPVGVIHIDTGKYTTPEIGLYIADHHLWGSDIGSRALIQTLFMASDLKLIRLWAFIHPKNKRSIRLFTSLKFIKTGSKINGLDIYEVDLSTTVRSESVIPDAAKSDRQNYQPCPA